MTMVMLDYMCVQSFMITCINCLRLFVVVYEDGGNACSKFDGHMC